MRFLMGVFLLFTGCTSIDSTALRKDEQVVSGGGEAVGLIQASALGSTFLFHLVELHASDLDTVVNRLLITEAKAMGASRVQLLDASTTPRHGLYALFGIPVLNLVGVTCSSARAIAVR